ncbi:MAG: PD40 domain-containing protein [Phycisphaerales bacterium]|nr:MAG: PD40 domain-containing protein [Phycisphaerales bacterium]
MRTDRPCMVTLSLACVLVCAFGVQRMSFAGAISAYNSVDRLPKIHPDYSSTVVPPNIAPLNFVIRESGSAYRVRIHSARGTAIEISSRSPKIAIPQRPWRELLEKNCGGQLSFEVSLKAAGSDSPSRSDEQWSRFSSFQVEIARDAVDGFLVYRKIQPAAGAWGSMGIYQRNLENFGESLVLNNGYLADGCLNCHTFCNNHTDKMLIGIRSGEYGSSALLIAGDVVNKIGTKFGYCSWHPSGKVVAYSINKVTQFFHSSRDEVRDVIDLDSLLAYYLVDSQSVKTSPSIAKKDRLESYPAWSADGRYLYFCSAPLSWKDRGVLPEHYDQIKYDLMRVSYDLDRDQWGQTETVLSATETGKSILLPRISPDGRWLLFCMCDYGCFPVYQSSSDLYIMDLAAAEEKGSYEYRRLAINSDQSESWHSFSSNGRWIAFSSKRQSGAFTRCYLSYIDEEGDTYKPIVLPQKDPTYYDSCLWTYSVPELVSEPVRMRKEKLGRVVRGSGKISVDMPITMATPRAGQLPTHEEPWLGGRE